jgi:hypothetical protein
MAAARHGPAFRQGSDFRHILAGSGQGITCGMTLPILWPTIDSTAARYASHPGAAPTARLPRGTDAP